MKVKNNYQNFFDSHLLKQGHPRNHFLPAIRDSKTLGLDAPATLLVRADEVIE